ncbi:hypothetical protein [Acidovorax kalamii]|uniref:Uncharacterized protein n=1 Tax=Acidovorax kalamii TaxID=2004485 RepID=A0A235EMX2_9BURK|nr:hypothetical protein [Acidovorax kalamii]OYD49795.1 hypothetical protein CBY09_12625 [Acidovorax kalamii]
MTPLRFVLTPACLAVGLSIASLGAQAQNTKTPKVQLWMDLSTGTMAGMPEMDSLPGGGGLLGGLMGGMGGGAAQGRAGSGNTAYGHARAMSIMPPRVIDLALHNSLRPGVEASQAIPAGMRMGESLPLIPPRAQPTQTEPGEVPQEYQQHQPKGRILLYWGCSATVRAGQPRVIDLARAKPSDYAQAFAGRAVPDRGPRVGPAYALYPNERNQVSLSRDSSVVGEHQVRGDGVPASMKFTLGAAQDLMPAIDLRTSGKPQDSMGTSWQPVRNARAYYLHAMSQSGDDLIMWSSAETPDTGMGLFDYLSPATIDRWLKERVLLQPETTQCAIPQGIFAGGGRDATPMLRMMAYGGESHIVHPPRPADPKAAWEPEWSVRVRVKSHTMAMLGEEMQGQRGGMGAATPAGTGTGGGAYSSGMGNSGQSSGGTPPDTATPGEVVNPVNLLRGLFGR